MLHFITRKHGIAILFAIAGAFTAAQSAESAKPATEASQSSSSTVTEEEKQQWIESRLAAFENIIAKDLQAREQLAQGIDELVGSKQLDRKSLCDATNALLADHVKVVAKLNQMILDIEKYQDRLNDAQRSRLLAAKAKMPELMSKIRGCENY